MLHKCKCVVVRKMGPSPEDDESRYSSDSIGRQRLMCLMKWREKQSTSPRLKVRSSVEDDAVERN